MFRSGYLGALALGSALLTAALVVASDPDVQRLDLKNSNTAGNGSNFAFEGRAMPISDDVQDVNLRYWLGYNRGLNGGIYILPRFYAFRAGFWDAYNGSPPNSAPFVVYWPSVRASYYGGWYPFYPGTIRWGAPSFYSYGSTFGSGAPAYASAGTYPAAAPFASDYAQSHPTTQPAYSAPNVASSAPANPGYTVPVNPTAGEPAPMPRKKVMPAGGQEGAYPYDGPPRKAMPPVEPPTYQYDGGPARPVPMPGVAPNPKLDPADGRVVSLTGKKAGYAAYGEKKKEKLEDGVRTVKGE
jgi:hypothetical protein